MHAPANASRLFGLLFLSTVLSVAAQGVVEAGDVRNVLVTVLSAASLLLALRAAELKPPLFAVAAACTVDAEELVQRLMQRAQPEGRADDTEEVIRRRQQVYTEQTEPLIEVYRDRGILLELDGMGEVDQVTRRIFDALDVVPQS